MSEAAYNKLFNRNSQHAPSTPRPMASLGGTVQLGGTENNTALIFLAILVVLGWYLSANPPARPPN